METKHFIILIFIVLMAIIADKYLEVYENKEMGRLQLEQCPLDPDGSTKLIWVRDCGVYLDKLRRTDGTI